MNTKIIGILIIVLGLSGIFGGAYFVYRQMYYVPDVPVVLEEDEKTNIQVVNRNINTFDVPIKTENGSMEKIVELQKKSVVISAKDQEVEEEDKTSQSEEQLKRTASLFAERFGSYSNQSNFSNISDLKIYMSTSMKEWADDFVRKNNIERDVSIYYGITTKSISQKVEDFNESRGEASILVNTLRRESGGTLSSDNSFYQEIMVNFVLDKGFWKVDSANWK